MLNILLQLKGWSFYFTARWRVREKRSVGHSWVCLESAVDTSLGQWQQSNSTEIVESLNLQVHFYFHCPLKQLGIIFLDFFKCVTITRIEAFFLRPPQARRVLKWSMFSWAFRMVKMPWCQRKTTQGWQEGLPLNEWDLIVFTMASFLWDIRKLLLARLGGRERSRFTEGHQNSAFIPRQIWSWELAWTMLSNCFSPHGFFSKVGLANLSKCGNWQSHSLIYFHSSSLVGKNGQWGYIIHSFPSYSTPPIQKAGWLAQRTRNAHSGTRIIDQSTLGSGYKF